MTGIILESQGITIDQVVGVARGGLQVQLSDRARSRTRAGRRVVEAAMAEGRPVYGVTTGLGSKVVHRLEEKDNSNFHRLVLDGRAMAAGPELPEEVVRAAMVARAAAMAGGASGARLEVLEGLVALLNAGVHPVVPSLGTVGAADLVPMAHLALPLAGAGLANFQGERLTGEEALQRAGLEAVELQAKDGLALCSSSALTAGYGALVLRDVEQALAAADLVAVMSMEGFRATPAPLDARAQMARNAPGQAEAASRLRGLLQGSRLFEPGEARRLQDPLSIRCIAPVHGALIAALEFASAPLEAELVGAGDNPLVLPDTGEFLHTANFHTPTLTLGFDTLGLSLCQVVTMMAQRATRLLSGRLTDLPDLLSPAGGPSAGLAPLTKTLQAAAMEIRQRSPASQQAVDGTEIEDSATWSFQAVERVADMLPRLRYAIAAEMLIAAQAIDLREPEALPPAVAQAMTWLRVFSPVVEADRALAGDLEQIASAIAEGRFPGNLVGA